MQLEKTDLANLAIIYGIHGKLLSMPTEAVYTGSMLGVLQPGEKTQYHRHHDNERFIILQGAGEMRGDKEYIAVAAGDIVNLSPSDGHILVNTELEKNLVFVSMWWAEKNGAIIPEIKNPLKKSQQYLIIAPPPTPNGDLHLGHLAGPYLAADILHRFLLQQKIPALFITGSDDHQSYVTLKAKQIHNSNEATAEHFSQRIQDVFDKFNIKTDLFYRPLHNRHYIDFVQKYFAKLLQSGSIQAKTVMQPYCEHCQHWLFEAHICGTCPHCHSACGGGGCETCAIPNTCTDMLNSQCKYCNQSPTMRATEHVYLALEKYRKPLQVYLDHLKLPAHIRTVIRKLFAQPLPDIAVTHHSEWGISAAFAGFEQQKICTWSEMAPAYIFAATCSLGCQPEQVEHLWQEYWNNVNNKITLSFGFDNSFYYVVLLPCLLMAFAENTQLPTEIIANEFYLFDQLKFSTSRGHAVWARDIIRSTPRDTLRYYLAATRPEVERTQFNYTSFVDCINLHLVNDLSMWIINLAERVAIDFNNYSPDGGEWNIEHDEFISYLHSFITRYQQTLNSTNFSPTGAIHLVQELVLHAKRLGANSYFLRHSDKKNKLEYQTSIVMELTAVKYFAIASNSIMPDYANKLANALQLPAALSWESEVRLFAKEIEIKNLAQCVFTPLTLGQVSITTTSPLTA
jgi:methionyl-tRNA synthetase